MTYPDMKDETSRHNMEKYSGVFVKIFVSTLSLCAILTVSFAAFSYALFESSLKKFNERNLELNASFFKNAIEAEIPVELLAATAKKGEETNVRTTLIKNDGTVVFDSSADLGKMQNHLGRSEVRRALSGKTAFAQRFSETLKTKLMYIAMPAKPDASGTPQYCVRQSAPFAKFVKSKTLFAMEIAGICAVSTVAAALFSWLLAAAISKPLGKLTNTAVKFSEGDFDAVVPHSKIAEIGALGKSLSAMAAQLRKRINSLNKRNCELDEILANMSECIFICTSNGEIRRFNGACSELFTGVHEGFRRPASEVFRNSGIMEAIDDVFKTGENVRREIEFEGEKIYELHGILLKYESKKGRALFVLRDISHEKNAERLRREFVAGASHELKTPLTTIKITAETLAENASGKEERHFISIIENETDRMAALVEDMLLLSRIEFTQGRAAENFAPFPIYAAVEEAVLSHRHAADAESDSLEIDCPKDLEINGDFTLVQIAVSNLVGNAVKYGGKNCKIRICAENTSEGVCLRVSDTGSGIDNEDLPRVFERFFRGDKGRSRARGGTGLGLALVKHIAILHNGRAEVRSELGKGSVFSIFFNA